MSTNTGNAAGQLAGRREWVGLAVLALPTLLMALDLSVLFLALPRLSVDLGADNIQQLWITDIYGFMIAGFLVTMGTLGDRIGRRRLLMIGATAFSLASVVAAFSVSPGMLIGARAVLGVAGATIAPSTLALISSMFQNPKQRAVAIAAWTSCFVGGNALGPLVGGLLLDNFWWGSVFLLGVPVMALLLATAPVLLPEFKAPRAGRLDMVSVAMSMLAVLPTIYGLKELARHGWSALPLLAIVVGVVVGVLFVRRQRALDDPLLDMRLFGHKTFSTAVAMMLFGGVFLGGVTLLVTQYLQLVEGLSPLAAGLWLLPSILAMVAGSMAAPIIARRIRPAYVMTAGLLIAAVGYIVLSQVGASGGLAALVIGWTITLGGNGLPLGLSVDLVIGSVPPEKAGSAASIQQTGTEFGIALGIAVVGSIATAVYRTSLTGNMPSSVPPDAAEAARAGMTDAVTLAQRLPELLAPAREAYTAGLNVAAGLSAVVFAALAVLALVMLRQVPTYGDAQAAAPDEGDGEAAQAGVDEEESARAGR